MSMQDEEIKNIVDRILTISPENKLSLLIPGHFTDPELYLENFAKKDTQRETPNGTMERSALEYI